MRNPKVGELVKVIATGEIAECFYTSGNQLKEPIYTLVYPNTFTALKENDKVKFFIADELDYTDEQKAQMYQEHLDHEYQMQQIHPNY
jgi:hypothetical protein